MGNWKVRNEIKNRNGTKRNETIKTKKKTTEKNIILGKT